MLKVSKEVNMTVWDQEKSRFDPVSGSTVTLFLKLAHSGDGRLHFLLCSCMQQLTITVLLL